MSRPLLVLRPEPGASATAARIVALGLEPRLAPLFVAHPTDWDVPNPGDHDALMLTSANAARLAGPGLARLASLPLYVVGQATAQAAREVGLTSHFIGDSDGVALVEQAVGNGVGRLLHLSGRDHMGLAHPALRIDRRTVYAAEAVEALPETARAALGDGAVTLLHSPRAARLFSALVDAACLDRGAIAIAALSPAVAAAAGTGWRALGAADAPRDDALLAVAARMCE